MKPTVEQIREMDIGAQEIAMGNQTIVEESPNIAQKGLGTEPKQAESSDKILVIAQNGAQVL